MVIRQSFCFFFRLAFATEELLVALKPSLRQLTSFIDTSMLGINSSCLSIQCGSESKLYGDIDCNSFLNTRCTNNSIGIYIMFIVMQLNYSKHVNSFPNIKVLCIDFRYKNVFHKTLGNFFFEFCLKKKSDSRFMD